jgi:hypothetical protein
MIPNSKSFKKNYEYFILVLKEAYKTYRIYSLIEMKYEERFNRKLYSFIEKFFNSCNIYALDD